MKGKGVHQAVTYGYEKARRFSLGAIRPAGRAGPSARPKRTPSQRITLPIEHRRIVYIESSGLRGQTKKTRDERGLPRNGRNIRAYGVPRYNASGLTSQTTTSRRPRDRRSHASLKNESFVTGIAIARASRSEADIGTHIPIYNSGTERTAAPDLHIGMLSNISIVLCVF